MKDFFFTLLALAVSASAPAETWRPLGDATIVDGWITPFYVDDNHQQIDPATCPFDVPVEECVETPGVYRLINPFGGKDFHLSDFNVDGTPCDIVIDTRDSRMVTIEPQYCGFTDVDPSEPSGYYKYYISDMGTYMRRQGQAPELIRLFGCASTINGRVITIPQPTVGTTPDNVIQASDPSFAGMIVLPEVDDDSDQWRTLGNATVIDGWLTPLFRDDESGHYYSAAEHPITCEVMVSTVNPDIYCIVSPFTSSTYHLSKYNLNTRDVRITFDMSDRDFVTMPTQFSGYISRTDDGMQPYYITDGGSYMLANGYTREQVIGQYYNSYYSDGVLNIVAPVFCLEPAGSAKVANEPQIAQIYFEAAGIDDVVTDDVADVTPIYYNLQGIEISNPTAGQVYICRKGKDVKKIIY
ncbi:MAG: hypothetical protein Q4C34_07490 [Bacteroidales bacterium]|nr:hypothetical protein [Bacteroidales bacterium]